METCRSYGFIQNNRTIGTVARASDGSWDWSAGGSKGNEPTKKMAIGSAETVLNGQDYIVRQLGPLGYR